MNKFTSDYSLVATGYSAGRPDSMVKFCDKTPCDNACYFVLNHVSGRNVNSLRQILAHHSPLDITEVHQQLPIENNTIYLMAPSQYLRLEDNHL